MILTPSPLTPARDTLFQVFKQWFEPRGVHVFRAKIGTPSPPCLLIGTPGFEPATLDGYLRMEWPIYAAVATNVAQQFDTLDSILMGDDSVDACLRSYTFEGMSVSVTNVLPTEDAQYDAGSYYSSTINLDVLITP